MLVPTTKLTYHDYCLLPDDGKRYEHYGVCEYWLVDPVERMINILTLKGTTFIEVGKGTSHTPIASSLLPDLPLDLTKLFA